MISGQELSVAVNLGVIYGLLALGVTLTFRVINFADLTCDGSFVLGAVVSAVMLKAGFSPWISFLAAFLAGGAAGFITGALHLFCKIEDLLSGILTAFMLYSVNLRMMKMNASLSLIGCPTLLDGSPWTLWGVVALCLLALTLFLNSDQGLALRTLGHNRSFAAAQGISVNLMIFVGVILSNAFVGACGSLFTQYQKFCDVSQGVGSLVVGLASVIIGEKSLGGRQFLSRLNCSVGVKNGLRLFLDLAACVVGSVLYRVFIALALHSDFLGLKTQDLNLITGLLIILMMRRKKKC